MESTDSEDLTMEECDFLQELCSEPISMDVIDEKVKKRQIASQRATLRTQRYRKKQHDELVYLRVKVKELEARYKQLVPLTDDTALGKWEKLAKNERKRAYDVLQENLRLKQALTQQIKFAESLAEVIGMQAPQPTIQNDFLNQWQFLKLVSEPVARRCAFDAIPDKEFEIIDSVFIDAGVMDDSQILNRIVPRLLDNDIEINVSACARFTAPFDLAVKAAWDLVVGDVPVSSTLGACSTLEKICSTIAYVHATWNFNLGTAQSRYIAKMYKVSDDRTVIVTRSVMEDELLPLEKNQCICNEIAWISLERTSNNGVCLRLCEKYREQKSRFDASTMEYLLDVFTQWSQAFDQAYTEYLTALVEKEYS